MPVFVHTFDYFFLLHISTSSLHLHVHCSDVIFTLLYALVSDAVYVSRQIIVHGYRKTAIHSTWITFRYARYMCNIKAPAGRVLHSTVSFSILVHDAVHNNIYLLHSTIPNNVIHEYIYVAYT